MKNPSSSRVPVAATVSLFAAGTLRIAVFLAVVLAATLAPHLAKAASATWLASPTDNNWISSNITTTATVNNWSTGQGLWPGGNSTSSGDTATFNNNSAITTILITNVGNIGTWNIKNITFDTANCAAYTITNAGGTTARFTGAGSITINSTVTQPQLITGSQYRLHTTGAINLINNSATPTATLTFAGQGVKANNSTETLLTDQAVNLQGSNTGSNAFSGVIADYDNVTNFYAAVTKSGAGTWYFTAANTYRGPTIVTGGLLALTSTGSINNSTNVVVGGGTLSIANTLAFAYPNTYLTVTNGGSFVITNTVFRTPVTVPTLTVSNATLHLGVNGAAPFTNFVVTAGLAIGPNTSISIDQFAGVTGITTFDLISYAGADPNPANISVTTAPGYAAGTPTVDTVNKLVTVSITPTAPPAGLTWQGNNNGDWDTTTPNWTNSAGTAVTYNQGDLVTFDDTAITTAVNLTTALTPSAFTNNTAATYTFGGVGKISGTTSLVKQGAGTLILTNSTPNDFNGGVVISAGTLQIGNGTTLGNLPASGAVLDNGSLIFNHSDAVAFAGAISGSGAVTQNGSGTLTLSGSSSFSGGFAINGGAVRANAVTAPGTGLVTVNSGATFVTGAAHTNSITLNNGILGTSLSGGFTMSTNKELTIAANTTNLIYSADPQTNVTSLQLLVDANLRGSGTVICINAPTNSPDSGQGVRFRNTNAVSDFSGTIIYTNGTKGELLTLTPAGGTYSPIGTGKLILYCGAYDGGNLTTAPVPGGFCELNLRNNGPGSIIIGNDISLLGSGAAVLNALAGTNGITMGNLKIGAGQELIGYKAASTATNFVAFTSVTLTGGNATFSPHSTTFGIAGQAGTDFSLGNIGELASGSGIIKAGVGNLTLTGANTYSGDTAIANGALFLSGSASIANSPHIVVASGAKLDVSALSSTFALGAAQTLSNSTSTAMISGNADASLGTVSLTYATNAPAFTITNGALTLAAGTIFQVNNTGPALVGGSYKIISAANTGNAGSVVGAAPSSVAVGGNGIATAVTPSLQISGNELFLVVPNTPPVIARIVTNSTSAGLTWKIAIPDLATAAGWSDADNNTLTLNSVGPTSNLGNSVTTDSFFIYYNAPVTAEDFFTYSITDGSATANGTVYLEPVAAPPAPATASQIVKDANGVPTITFAGIPGRTNVVEASTNMILWTAISTNVAGTNGLWQVTDPDATNFVNRFYRSYQPYP